MIALNRRMANGGSNSAGKGRRARRKPASASGRVWRTALRWAGAGLALLVILSVIWVGVYRIIDPPTTWLIVTTRWSGIAIAQRQVPLEAIAPVLYQTVIGSEDQNFCSHHGFDTKAIDEAIEHDEQGGRLRGASTISQQTAKNAFLWPARNFLRKGLEAYFTVIMETLWPKRRIMEVYLNIAQFGPGVFGAEAAAQRFFDKPARDLSQYEAALLAAVLPDPRRMHADRPSSYVRMRADELAARAADVRRDGLAQCVER
jgi:monofunctional glycosyltransferase